MTWEEFKKILYESIVRHEGVNIICKDEEAADKLVAALHEMHRNGLILR